MMSMILNIDTSSESASVSIASDGELLWRFFKTMDDNIGTSTDDIVESDFRLFGCVTISFLT